MPCASAASNKSSSSWKGRVVALPCSAQGHCTGNRREESLIMPPAKLSHTTQVSRSKGRQMMGCKNGFKPNSNGLCKGSGEPRLSPAVRTGPKAPAAPGCDPHTVIRAVPVRWAELKAFSLLGPTKFLPAGWVSGRSCSQHCCFCTRWDSCQNI